MSARQGYVVDRRKGVQRAYDRDPQYVSCLLWNVKFDSQ
jgi:hypothetical protein